MTNGPPRASALNSMAVNGCCRHTKHRDPSRTYSWFASNQVCMESFWRHREDSTRSSRRQRNQQVAYVSTFFHILDTSPQQTLSPLQPFWQATMHACKVVENVQRDSTAQNLKGKKPESRKESRWNSMGITAEMRACYTQKEAQSALILLKSTKNGLQNTNEYWHNCYAHAFEPKTSFSTPTTSKWRSKWVWEKARRRSRRPRRKERRKEKSARRNARRGSVVARACKSDKK